MSTEETDHRNNQCRYTMQQGGTTPQHVPDYNVLSGYHTGSSNDAAVCDVSPKNRHQQQSMKDARTPNEERSDQLPWPPWMWESSDDESWKCSNCGHWNTGDDRWCDMCEYYIPVPPPRRSAMRSNKTGGQALSPEELDTDCAGNADQTARPQTTPKLTHKTSRRPYRSRSKGSTSAHQRIMSLLTAATLVVTEASTVQRADDSAYYLAKIQA